MMAPGVGRQNHGLEKETLGAVCFPAERSSDGNLSEAFTQQNAPLWGRFLLEICKDTIKNMMHRKEAVDKIGAAAYRPQG